MEQNMGMGALSVRTAFLNEPKWCRKYNITADAENLENAQRFISEGITDAAFAHPYEQAP